MPSPLSAIPPSFQIGPAEAALLEKNGPTPKAFVVEESFSQAEPSSIDVLPNEIFDRVFTYVTKGGGRYSGTAESQKCLREMEEPSG